MSKRREAVARSYFEPHAGADFIAPLMDAIGRRAELGDEGAIAAVGPAWATLSPEIEFDTTPVVGGNENVYRGFGGFLDYWNEWLGMWEEYIYVVHGYVPVGRWIVADLGLRAQGRSGPPLEMRVAQACEIRDSKIVRMRVYPTVGDARDALSGSGIRGAVERLTGRG